MTRDMLTGLNWPPGGTLLGMSVHLCHTQLDQHHFGGGMFPSWPLQLTRWHFSLTKAAQKCNLQIKIQGFRSHISDSPVDMFICVFFFGCPYHICAVDSPASVQLLFPQQGKSDGWQCISHLFLCRPGAGTDPASIRYWQTADVAGTFLI